MDPTHIRDIPVHAAVITISSTRTADTDIGGATIRKLLENANIPVVYSAIVPDDVEKIRKELRFSLGSANCIIFTGGTGLTHDDCTIEAVTPLLDKMIDGFGELFRLKSYDDIGTRALLSRALAGVSNGKAVFCIPGSVGAVTLAVRELIIPEIRHILTHASS